MGRAAASGQHRRARREAGLGGGQKRDDGGDFLGLPGRWVRAPLFGWPGGQPNSRWALGLGEELDVAQLRHNSPDRFTADGCRPQHPIGDDAGAHAPGPGAKVLLQQLGYSVKLSGPNEAVEMLWQADAK